MPQRIAMSENPIEDIEKLSEMVNTLLRFGMIHEELDNEMAEAMLLWTCKQDELIESIRLKMEENEDESDILDYVRDNYGQYHFIDMISEIDNKDLQLKSALMFRHIIFNILNQTVYQDVESVVEECEAYIAEDEL